MSMMRLQNISALKRKNVHLPNYRENQVNGNCTRTKKLKLQKKLAPKLPFRQVQFVSPTVQFIRQDSFLLHSSFALFFSHPPLLEFFFWLFPSPQHIFNIRPQGFHFESIVEGMFEFGKLFIYFNACLKLHIREWQTLLVGNGHVVLKTCNTLQSMKCVVAC